MTKTDIALERLINEGYEFKLQNYINDGFALFKKNIGGFAGFYAILFSVFFVVGLIFGDYATFITNLLQPILVAGALIVANDIYRGKSPDFLRFFDGFKHFLGLFILSLVSGLLIVVGIIFLIVPGIYLAVSYSFANMFVIFLGYEFWPAMELSRQIITKNWWQFFGFLIIIGLINIGGLLACGVGVIFTAPATMCMTYCAFEDIVGGAIRKQEQSASKQDPTNTSEYPITQTPTKKNRISLCNSN